MSGYWCGTCPRCSAIEVVLLRTSVPLNGDDLLCPSCTVFNEQRQITRLEFEIDECKEALGGRWLKPIEVDVWNEALRSRETRLHWRKNFLAAVKRQFLKTATP